MKKGITSYLKDNVWNVEHLDTTWEDVSLKATDREEWIKLTAQEK